MASRSIEILSAWAGVAKTNGAIANANKLNNVVGAAKTGRLKLSATGAGIAILSLHLVA